MKKLFFIFNIFFQTTYLLTIDDWGNQENFILQASTQSSLTPSCYDPKYPNKPVIANPLTNEAYSWVKKQYEKDLTPSQEFIEFLKKRSDFHDSEIEAQWKLIETLTLNYASNKNLTPLTLSMAAFAAATSDLCTYQFTAESRYCLSSFPLTTFEQKYSFKLYPTTYENYAKFFESTSPTLKDLYKKTVLKKWARYLLRNLTKK